MGCGVCGKGGLLLLLETKKQKCSDSAVFPGERGAKPPYVVRIESLDP